MAALVSRFQCLAKTFRGQVHKNVHRTLQMPVKFQTFQQARKYAVQHQLGDFEHRGSTYINKPGSPYYLPDAGAPHGTASGHMTSPQYARQDALAHGEQSFTHLGARYNRRPGMSDVYDPETYELSSDQDPFELDAKRTDTDDEPMPFSPPLRPFIGSAPPPWPRPQSGKQPPKKKKRIVPVHLDGAAPEGNLSEQELARNAVRGLQESRRKHLQSFEDRYLSKADQVRLAARELFENLQDMSIRPGNRIPMELKVEIFGLEGDDADVDPSEVIYVADKLAEWLDNNNTRNDANIQQDVNALKTAIQRICDLDEQAEQEGDWSSEEDQGVPLAQLGQGQQQQSDVEHEGLDDSQIEIVTPAVTGELPLPPPPPVEPAFEPASKPAFEPAFQPAFQPASASKPVEPRAARPGIETQHLGSYGGSKRGALKRLVQSHNTRTIRDAADKLGVPVKTVNRELKRERGRLAHDLGLSPAKVAELGPDEIQSAHANISPTALHHLINHRLVTTTWPVKGKGARDISPKQMLGDYAARTGRSIDDINWHVDEQHRLFRDLQSARGDSTRTASASTTMTR